VLYIFRFKINTLLCYTVVSVLVLGIGIARGQYYWILDALFGIVLTLTKITRSSPWDSPIILVFGEVTFIWKFRQKHPE